MYELIVLSLLMRFPLQGIYPRYKELALQVMRERARLWQTEVDWTVQLQETLAVSSEQVVPKE